MNWHSAFGLIIVICAAVWVVRMWRKRFSRPLCPDCRRWHENSCSVPERPNVIQCRLFEPEDFSEITREAIEEEEEEQASVIDLDRTRGGE